MRVPHKRISESDDRMTNTVRQTVSSGVFAEKTIRTAYGEPAKKLINHRNKRAYARFKTVKDMP